MLERQNNIRQEVRILKAKEDISFKEIAEELLNMNYHSFINWLNQPDIRLSEEKLKLLECYVWDILY